MTTHPTELVRRPEARTESVEYRLSLDTLLVQAAGE